MIGKVRTRHWDMAAATYETLLDEMEAWRRLRGRTRLVCFCDANGIAAAWRDPELRAAYRKADAVVADGVAALGLAAAAGGRLPGRVIGPVLFARAMARGVPLGWRHFLCGTSAETLAALKANLEARFPGVRIVGTHSPEYSDDPNPPPRADCDFMWVALGCPKQEKWCARHLEAFGAAAVLPVGAAFDFHAGAQKPVPAWVHRLGVCWLWRILTGGWRVLRRNLRCVPQTAWILLCEFARRKAARR